MKKLTLSEIKELNQKSGYYFFEKETMKFFNSRVESPIYKGNFFITSEKMDVNSVRRFTIRQFNEKTNEIVTIGNFQQFSFIEDAKEMIKEQNKK